jgi:transposase
MTRIVRIGLDTSKNLFQLHGVDEAERPVLRKQVRRAGLIALFRALPPALVGLEACGGSHYWAREIGKFGHEVRLMPPQYAKAYRKRNKNDAADAEALCEAVGRPTMRFVRPKSLKDQSALMLAGVRDQLVRERTKLSNAIRGYAMECGLTVGKGLCRLDGLLADIAVDEALPALTKDLFAVLARQYTALQAAIGDLDKKLMRWHRSSEVSRRLAAIPGIGPISAVMLRLKVSDARAFSSGRKFASWLGLTPKDHSTAGRTKLGSITHAGDPALRSLLVVGAMSVIRQATRGKSKPSAWLAALLERKPPKKAAVALANKTARIAWKLMVSGDSYDPRPMAAIA